MINLKDHLPERKFISKIVLKTQEVKLGDTPDTVSLESVQINEESDNPLVIDSEVLGGTKADEMIKHSRAKEDDS